MIKKEVEVKEVETEYLKWFSELSKDSIPVAGGKGANLSEMYNFGIPVPPGFVLTAEAYNHFLDYAGIRTRIKELLSRIHYEDTKELDEITGNIRTIMESAPISKKLQEELFEAYDILGSEGKNFEKGSIMDVLKRSSEPAFVAVRSSATTEDLAEASFAGQQETFLNVKGREQLLFSVKKCFASLFTSRATYYRHKKGFEHTKASLAVVVQKMIDADKSGVMFSKDPTYKNDHVIIEAVFGLGEGIVSGRITPDKYLISKDLKVIDKKISNKKTAITRDSQGNNIVVILKEEKANQQVLKESEIIKLAEFGLKLEEHYNKPQDIEFALENNEIFIVQTRPITTIQGRIEQGKENTKVEGKLILSGLAASPGIASGVVKIVKEMKDLDKIIKGDILVTEMTNPDMVVTMQKCAAIVTDEGGMTAHAAIVSREMGIPCVVGTGEATKKLIDGQKVTVDGFDGKVYLGITHETVQKEVKQVEEKTKTKIKVIVDLPTFAERASKTGLKSVGLTRIEGIIAESGKHPNFFTKSGKYRDYENVIYNGVSGIARYFEEIWVRTSDIRSDEYHNLEGAPKEIEANPMLGMHGIRFSLKNPELFKAELRALKRVAEEGKKIGVLLPQVIMVEEVKRTREILDEIGFYNAKLGVMIETPAAVQIIKCLCDEKIDFISFGTNDLTQFMLAIDRGNEKVQYLYNEMHPAMLYQLEYVIRVCKRNNVESSICGQSGSRKDMVKFLVDCGIDSISVNADVAEEIAKFVSELEEKREKEEE